MSEEKAKVKALFPEDVEGIYISKNDYDRLYGDLTLENIELKQEIERLNNIIKEAREYIENNSLYEEDYDYDYEENLVVGPPSDEIARKILLEILDKGE